LQLLLKDRYSAFVVLFWWFLDRIASFYQEGRSSRKLCLKIDNTLPLNLIQHWTHLFTNGFSIPEFGHTFDDITDVLNQVKCSSCSYS
jgi:hypothetical protein